MVAKIEGNPPPTLPGVTPDALVLAMRTLLADRFNLNLHHEQREMDVYALALAEAANGAPGRCRTRSSRSRRIRWSRPESALKVSRDYAAQPSTSSPGPSF
jgi:hypothetical protein